MHFKAPVFTICCGFFLVSQTPFQKQKIILKRLTFIEKRSCKTYIVKIPYVLMEVLTKWNSFYSIGISISSLFHHLRFHSMFGLKWKKKICGTTGVYAVNRNDLCDSQEKRIKNLNEKRNNNQHCPWVVLDFVLFHLYKMQTERFNTVFNVH